MPFTEKRKVTMYGHFFLLQEQKEIFALPQLLIPLFRNYLEQSALFLDARVFFYDKWHPFLHTFKHWHETRDYRAFLAILI